MIDQALLNHYLGDHVYMAPAWLGCLHWAIGQPDCLTAFREDTGHHWTPGRTPIHRMIDTAVGADKAFIEAFIPWFHENVWGDEDTDPDEAVPPLSKGERRSDAAMH